MSIHSSFRNSGKGLLRKAHTGQAKASARKKANRPAATRERKPITGPTGFEFFLRSSLSDLPPSRYPL